MVFIGGIRNITGVRERCRYPCTGSGEHKNQGGDRQGHHHGFDGGGKSYRLGLGGGNAEM